MLDPTRAAMMNLSGYRHSTYDWAPGTISNLVAVPDYLIQAKSILLSCFPTCTMVYAHADQSPRRFC